MNMSIRFPHLGINLGYVGETVSVFGFEITIYGIFIAVGMLAGLSFIILQAKRQNQDQNLYLQALIPGVLFGVVCARLCYIALHWKIFAKEPQRALWDIRTGGMVMYGALLGGIAALAVFCKIRKLSFGRMADTIIPGHQSDDRSVGEFFQQRVYRKIYRQHSGYAASGRDFKRCKADGRNAGKYSEDRRYFLCSGASAVHL